MTDKLRNTNPVHIAFRAIDLYRAYLEHGLTETVASAAAIGELKTELDDLEDIDFTPPNRDERDWERGGFAPGRAGWEGEIDV